MRSFGCTLFYFWGSHMKKDRTISIALALVFAFIFLIMLYCNMHTSLLTDDYAYMFDFTYSDTPELSEHRISSILQIFPSMAAHRVHMNGRVVSHFLVQMFLFLPIWLFKFLNPLVFVAEIYIIYRCSFDCTTGQNGIIRLLIPCFVFCCIWLFQPSFGQVNLWLDGAVNYLWAAVFSLVFIKGYIDLCRTGELCRGRAAKMFFVVFSFAAGAYCENSGGTIILFSLGMILYVRFVKRQKLSYNVYASFAAAVLGFVFLLMAPAELTKKLSVNDLSFSMLLSRLADLFSEISTFTPLIVSAAVLLLLACLSDIDRDIIFIAGLIFLSAIAACGCLVLGPYIARRSLFLTVVLLILDCSILIVPLLQYHRKIIYAFILALLLFTPEPFFTGIVDIDRTYYETSQRDRILTNSANAGEKDVYLPPLVHSGYTEYSPANDLLYLSSDPNYYPNCYIAYYYGFDHVYLDYVQR